MIVSDLKKSILQYALCGKLCQQLSSDTSIDDMLDSIKDQKKYHKSRLNKFSNNNKLITPFDIPNSWRWVELKDIALDVYAGGDKPKKFSKTKTETYRIPVISNGETNDGIIGYTDVATESENSLTVAGRGTIGFSKYRSEPFTPIVRLIVIKLPKEVNYKYLQRVFELLIEPGVGTSIKQLTVPMIVNKLIPLPPIEEQQRIVDKIEKLWDKLNEIVPLENKIKIIKENFHSDIKKSILDEAFKGYLTNRKDQDSSVSEMMKKIIIKHEYLIDSKIVKKEKKVSAINEKDFPYIIPDEWRWTKLYFCLDVRDGTHDSPRYCADGIPLITSKNLNKDGTLNKEDIKYINKEEADKINTRSKVDKGDILFAMIGSIGNPVLITENPNFCIKNVALFKNPVKDLIDEKYLYYYFVYSQEKMKKESTGGVQQFVSLNYLRNFYIPIPPVEEQKRIVDKLEQLLPLCDDI